jgi:large subunit ribosomal protein L10
VREKVIAEKQKIVEDLRAKISRARVMVVSDYLGFTVKEITDLRRKLRAEDSEFKIVKNTLISRAVSEGGYEELKEYLKGSTALLLGYRDAISPLKVLIRHLKEVEKGGIRGGWVEGRFFRAEELQEISKLPAREALLSRMIGGFQAPIYGLVNVLSGPMRKLVYVLSAIKEKKGG